MKTITALALAGLFAVSPWSGAATAAAAPAAAAAPDAAHIAAVHALLAAMQAEKMMRATAGASNYANPQQRQAVYDKLAKVPAEEIYRRLAGPVARLVSSATATEMTRFYGSAYGKRALFQTYNSGASLYPEGAPTPTPAEKADLKRPAYVAADKALAAAQPAIQHEAFVLLQEIVRKK
ncbi:hypothetical protein ACFDR9_004159 [Janthinobacterium sp. CG_23.3]|uniref:hypothetical protein n=1 Tax=Janthinobacterium sp. CG_23.3 TaxID=3349634 RepID=UPI0038D4F26D